MVTPTGKGCHRVLIVDQSEDSREVLRTALKRRGVQTFEASHASAGLQMAQHCQPDVVVLDLESCSADPETDSGALSRQLDRQLPRGNTSVVFLGQARAIKAALPAGQFIRKPYHYAPLIQTILSALDQKSPAAHRERGSRSLRSTAATTPGAEGAGSHALGCPQRRAAA